MISRFILALIALALAGVAWTDRDKLELSYRCGFIAGQSEMMKLVNDSGIAKMQTLPVMSACKSYVDAYQRPVL